MSLEGKLVIVTGGTMPNGIGRSAALALAADGADVVVTGFTTWKGQRLLRRRSKPWGVDLWLFRMDASNDMRTWRKAFANHKGGARFRKYSRE